MGGCSSKDGVSETTKKDAKAEEPKEAAAAGEPAAAEAPAAEAPAAEAAAEWKMWNAVISIYNNFTNEMKRFIKKDGHNKSDMDITTKTLMNKQFTLIFRYKPCIFYSNNFLSGSIIAFYFHLFQKVVVNFLS